MRLFRPSPLLLALSFLSASCGGGDTDSSAGKTAEVPPELKENQLARAPSTFLSAAADSPIHWQRWNPEVMETARKAERLLFVVAGSARYPGCFETVRAIERRPGLVRRLNEEFVPVLVDIDICRETALIGAALSAEARQPVAFPFILLLSPEGAPVSWQPISYRDDRSVYQFFDNSVDVVARLWNESKQYVLDDSRKKFEARRERMPEPDPAVPEAEERAEIHRAAIRRIVSFYDEDIQSLAGTGGLFPFGLIDSLALAHRSPDLPDDLRERAAEAIEGLLPEILGSAMVDPLDGGIYPARRGGSWQLPTLLRSSATQARAARVFSRLHELDLSDRALETAIGAIRFAEDRFRTPEGLFALAQEPTEAPEKEWLWTTDQLASVLSDDERKLWTAVSGVDPLGNLPSEADPDRRFFRHNTLAIRTPVAEAAADLGLDPGEAAEIFESGRRKLLKAREARFPSPPRDHTPSASASFRIISAYAALYTATGDDEWREKAVALGEQCRDSFLHQRYLNERPGDDPEEMSDARAFTYNLAIQATLDLGAVTLDDEWNLWAQDMITLLAENFVVDGEHLVEARPSVRVIELNYEDRAMIYSESTAGMVRNNLGRLRSLGFRTPPALEPWTTSLPPLKRRPIIHTDTLRALSLETCRRVFHAGREIPGEITDLLSRQPLGLVERRRDEGAAGVQYTGPDGATRSFSESAALREFLRGPR